ncbi:MAG: type II toxin-antitoxin system HicA family toxin [Armatimonadetes bacterium]|nr:type II toxin-antitoxin system HicA family toxin [Armatimonadota bacterium]
MRLPRDLSGDDLARKLGTFGYDITRQTGSHLRLTTQENRRHHLTIPRYRNLRVGTPAAVIRAVAEHFVISRDIVAQKLFGKRRGGGDS